MVNRVDSVVVGRWKIRIEAGSSHMIPLLRRNAWGIRMERRMSA